MKTNDLLNQLSQNISDSYDIIETGGGTMPLDRVTWNLPDAIRTIPEPIPDVPLYGKVEYYPWSQARNVSGDMVEIGDVDEDKLEEFLATYPPMDDMTEFMYEQDWESEDPESNYVWRYFWEEGELKIQPEDFTSTTGIQATLEEGADWASITIEKSYIVDTSAELLTAEFSSLQQFQDFNGGSESDILYYYVKTVGDSEVLNQSVYSIVIGREITSIPNYFITYDENLAEFDLSGAVVTSIGKGFLYSCHKFNRPLALDNVETIGSEFLSSCQAFNQPIDVTAFSEIPGQFLNYCSSFNQPLDFSNVTTIGNDVLYACSAFNQPLDLRKVTTIGISFLGTSSSFNSPIQLQALQSVGEYFLYSCSSFNQPITVPSTLNSMGTHFMDSCDSMTSAITCNCPGTVVPINDYTLSTFSTSAPIYSTGATLTGQYASAWKSRLPDRNTEPYRKLIVAS